VTILGLILAGLMLLAGVLWWCWPVRCERCGRRGRLKRIYGEDPGDSLRRHDLVCPHCGTSWYTGKRSDYWRGM